MLYLHNIACIFGAKEKSGIVDCGNKLKYLLRHFFERARLRNSRICDEKVKSAVFENRLVYHVLYRRFVCNIDRDGNRSSRAVFRVDLIGDRLSPLKVHVRNDHDRSFFEHFFRYAFSEALRGACNDRDLSRKTLSRARGKRNLRSVRFYFPIYYEIDFILRHREFPSE